MKNFALVAAFALLASTVPASAAEISGESSKVAPATTLEQQLEGRVAPLELIKPPLIQRCWMVQGTSCTTIGATMGCTDSCSNNLSCTCVYYYSNPSVWFWNCDWEC
jgi:hypothetical protein